MSVKRSLRNGAARLLFRAGLTAPRRRAHGQLSIATFHRVLPEAQRQVYPYPGLVVTPGELDAFLSYFAAHFDCGPLRAQHERHLRNEQPARPLLALTFDDGQHDNFLYARPLLERHAMKASFFVPVAALERRELLWHDRLGFAILALLRRPDGRKRVAHALGGCGLSDGGSGSLAEIVVGQSKRLPLGQRLRLVEALVEASGAAAPEFARLMSFEELAALAAEGHEIGSHSMTHCLMPECDDGALAYELSESRRILQEKLHRPVDSFCYPNGDCDARSAGAAAAAGYLRAVTTDWGLNGPAADRFRLRRCDMDAAPVSGSNGVLPALLAFRMSGLYPGLS